jgi:hypothetical protein
VVFALRVTVQVPIPEQPPPLHPLNVEPPAADAVSVTTVPPLYASEQSAPQLIPAGLEVTVPLPVPDFVTFSVNVWTCALKLAVTVVAVFIVTVQVPVPEPPPLQPANVDPPAAAAVSVTTVPLVYDSEQSAPQLIPAGEDVTVPLPVPDLVTFSVNVWTVKLAVTVVAAFIVTVQVPVPEQPPPLQPLNVDPPAADAVSVTTVPPLYASEQSAPQLIPAGLDVTVPLPVPDLVTFKVLVPDDVLLSRIETLLDP